MAYTDETDAFHRHTSTVHASTTIKGVLGVRTSYEVGRNPISADGALGPTAHPVQTLRQTAVLRFLDGNGVLAYGTAAGNLVHNFTAADGGSGSITQALMVASSWEMEAESPEGGFAYQQTYDAESSTPSYTISH
ncbi:MAG: hypothetical protein GY851_03405 [bacterium]|nr:hypothetical protein [bacterium]